MREIINLEAGREMDTLVAARVMGWSDWREDSGGRRIKAPGENSRPFSPSTDIRDAFEVAAKIGTNFVLEWVKDAKILSGCPFLGTGSWIAGLSFLTCMRGETAPLAICRMAVVAADLQSKVKPEMAIEGFLEKWANGDLDWTCDDPAPIREEMKEDLKRLIASEKERSTHGTQA